MKKELKVDPRYFEESWSDRKLFEIRKNDRDYRLEDDIVLREFDEPSNLYTGREINGRISYITDFEQKEGWIVFSLGKVWKTSKAPVSAS